MKIVTMLCALALLSLSPLAGAQSLRAPSLPTSYIAASDDPTNGIARAENASYTAFEAAALQSLAQTPNDQRVVVPWGEWLGSLLTGLALTIGTVVAGLLTRIVGNNIAADRLRSYTQNAVDYAINLVEGATHDQALTVPVANQVLERALEYSVDMFGGLVKQFGGTDAQRQRIVARLNVAGVMAAPARTIIETVHPAPSPATP